MTDNLFDLAASLGFKDLGLVPQGVRPLVAADSEGRAGVRPVPGAAPSMPKPLGPPRFGDGRPHPGQPGPPPQPRPTGPVPHPPPPVVLGVGVPYDSLPPADDRPFRDRVRSNP